MCHFSAKKTTGKTGDSCVSGVKEGICIYIYIPRESKNQTLPIGSGESFICIILKAILCLVLDFQGVYINR